MKGEHFPSTNVRASGERAEGGFFLLVQILHSPRALLGMMSSRGGCAPSQGSSPYSIPKHKSPGLGRPQTGDQGHVGEGFTQASSHFPPWASLQCCWKRKTWDLPGILLKPSLHWFSFHQDEILLTPCRESPYEDGDSYASSTSSAPSASAVSPAQLREGTNPHFPCPFPVPLYTATMRVQTSERLELGRRSLSLPSLIIPCWFYGQNEEWDFVLVSDIHETGSEKEIKRNNFLEELKRKGFSIKVRGCGRKRQQILGLAWAPASEEMGEA